jgi:hypothetical protein
MLLSFYSKLYTFLEILYIFDDNDPQYVKLMPQYNVTAITEFSILQTHGGSQNLYICLAT